MLSLERRRETPNKLPWEETSDPPTSEELPSSLKPTNPHLTSQSVILSVDWKSGATEMKKRDHQDTCSSSYGGGGGGGGGSSAGKAKACWEERQCGCEPEPEETPGPIKSQLRSIQSGTFLTGNCLTLVPAGVTRSNPLVFRLLVASVLIAFVTAFAATLMLHWNRSRCAALLRYASLCFTAAMVGFLCYGALSVAFL